MKITEKELQVHRKLMSDFIYSIVMPKLLEVKGIDPQIALDRFRENQHLLLKKYNFNQSFYIDFDGEIKKR